MQGNLTYRIFEKLFADNRDRCTILAYTYVRDKEAARDIVHDSFLYLWEKRDELEVVNLDAYIYKIVRNKCLQYRRDTTLHREIHEKIRSRENGMMEYFSQSIESCNPEEIFRKEIIRLCRQKLKEMPEVTQTIYRMSRIEGLSYKEISEKLDIPVKKVDRELQYAARQLRSALADYLPSIAFFVFLASM